MKNFEFVTASSNDLQIALKNLKEGIIKQFGDKNYSIANIFISQQVMMNAVLATPQNSQGSVLVFNITAQLVDLDSEVYSNEKAIETAGMVKNIFDQEF